MNQYKNYLNDFGKELNSSSILFLPYRVNIEILGTLLRNGTSKMQFGYVLYIMDVVKQERLRVNDVFIRHLEVFNDKCVKIIEKVIRKIYNLFFIRYLLQDLHVN